MTQPKIDGVGHGVPRMLYANDGSNWYAILVDSDGHVKVDVVSAALGTGGATEATLLLIKGYVDALETLLAGGLPAALDSGALKIKEQSPLTGFATSANQATMITALQLIDDLRAALGSVNTDDLQVDVKTTVPPVPATPINKRSAANVSPSTWTDLVTYTVPAGKTFYLHYWAACPSVLVAGFAFITRITVDDSPIDYGHAPVGSGVHISLPVPIKIAAEGVIAVEAYHSEAGANWMSGTFVGFNV